MIYHKQALSKMLFMIDHYFTKRVYQNTDAPSFHNLL